MVSNKPLLEQPSGRTEPKNPVPRNCSRFDVLSTSAPPARGPERALTFRRRWYLSTLCMGTTSRSCSLNFPSWTFSVHSWARGRQVREERLARGRWAPTPHTPAGWGTPEAGTGPRCPVLLWSGSQNPLQARCGAHHLLQRQGSAVATREPWGSGRVSAGPPQRPREAG